MSFTDVHRTGTGYLEMKTSALRRGPLCDHPRGDLTAQGGDGWAVMVYHHRRLDRHSASEDGLGADRRDDSPDQIININ